MELYLISNKEGEKCFMEAKSRNDMVTQLKTGESILEKSMSHSEFADYQDRRVDAELQQNR